MYYLIYSFVYLHALLPLRILYVFSDFLFYVVYYVVGYRKKIVRKNLTDSFPEKSTEKIIETEKKFYRHFCDYIVETIKLAHISDEEMKKRMIFKNVDLINQIMADNRSCIMLLGHYGNWEWVPSVCLYLKKNFFTGQIYHPLSNKAVDKLMLKLRGRFGTKNITTNDTFREIVKMKRAGRQFIIGFISDQSPMYNDIHYVTHFLNQENTPMITGYERIAGQMDFIVVYLDVIKLNRGHYEAEYKVITEHPKECADFEITEKYTREMEKTILRNPAYWLWTHRKWKHKKSIGIQNRT
ncbi:MAG: lysophospholipid acyltransferase family protein [Candidatus Azobacteroides sp.]|nr:lysophospholipid acyltransferase family protein [Candidatus Azobacteroides sp.]